MNSQLCRMSTNAWTVAVVLLVIGIAFASSSASYNMVDPQRVLSNAGISLGASVGGDGAAGGGTLNELVDATPPKPTELLRNIVAVPSVSVTREATTADLTSTAPSVYNETSSNATDNSILWSKYIARSGYALPVDPLFVAKINPFWLQFEPPSAGEHYGLAVFYFLMMLFGVIGNALVVFMFYRYRSLRTPANYLVINLAVADFIIMMEAPMFIYNSIHQGPALGSIGCTVYALMGALGGTVAIATLTVISIDRYNVVVYPLNPNRSTTKLKCYILIAFTWAYGLLFSSFPALEIGLSRYSAEGYLTACSFDYLDRTYKARVFMFVYFVFAWLLPFLIISYCYARILIAVINANAIQSSKSKNKTEVKLAGVVVGIIGLWFAAWTPYAVVAMMGVFGYEQYLTPMNSMIPAVFAKIAATIDPYFYAMNHPRYRQMLERMFCNRGADQGNSQYQTSHYTRGASRAGDSDGGGGEESGGGVGRVPGGGGNAASMRAGSTGRGGRLITAKGMAGINAGSGNAGGGGVKALKKQLSNGDETSLEVSLEM
ncbi:opsin-2 [Anopheles stephensi]|uniref:opsin-2 n=1 Tax=Anopheles stephensi TaxID=30069 RepID=UPI001658B18E|nr:opsin-2 [Anopheles stephensi]XP_035912049.1 opsin-2 [Anopheles stephensi]